VDVVLEAFAQVRAEIPAATLTLAGYGSEEARLRRLARAGVRFVGRIDPGAMPRLLDDADIFVNASVVDNQPVSILEAFAAGLPVVSTPTGDIAAMVRHEETGLIVPPLDPGALAAAVLRLVRDPDLGTRLTTRAHQECERYTWSAVRGEWASAYENAADRERPARRIRSWMSVRTR
jgi:glycosyltransferase involved in cell wall biosynthesis